MDEAPVNSPDKYHEFMQKHEEQKSKTILMAAKIFAESRGVSQGRV